MRGTLNIDCGNQVLPGVVRFTELGATFVNEETLHFDAVIVATGYKSNVCTWLKVGLLNLTICFS